MQTSSNDIPEQISGLAGDPNCPVCEGTGYLRADVPVGHPDFGRMQICTCRKQSIHAKTRRRLYSLSNLDELGHLTFENFQVRGRIGLAPLQADSLEQAYNHSQQFANSPKGWLVLQGKYGSGKTHLAAAIANFSVDLDIPTLFITVPDLLDVLRFSYNDPDATFEERFEEIRNVDLLVMDDFGTQNATSWAQEKLFQIINYRYINQLPMVITTNLGLSDIEGRIRSRIQDPEIVTRVRITATDYRRPADDTGHHPLSSLDLVSDKAFGNFKLRKEENIAKNDLMQLEKAFRKAQSYAENPAGWLVFQGDYGSGKTHLAAAIANFRDKSGFDTMFVVVPDLLDHLRATFNPRSPVSYDKQFYAVRNASLLVLDDMGSQAMSEWVREKLFQVLNHRYNAKLPTVITTVNKLEEIDPRIRTRMLDRSICTIHAITVPAYHGP